MEKKIKYSDPIINLNIDNDDSDLNNFLYCWDQFGSRPNKIIIHNTYSCKLFNELFKDLVKDKNFFTEVLPTDDGGFVINDKMFIKIHDDIYCSYIVFDRNFEKTSIVSEISFFYKKESNFEFIQNLISQLNDCFIDYEDDYSIINTISIGTNGLELEPIDISDKSYDNIDLYYNRETFKEIDKLIKGVKKSNAGLSILYGERGTGKTSIINYLSSKLDRIVIFIPNTMIEQTINNQEFRKFLKRYSKPIIILDDCEILFNDYYSKASLLSNNLLQMVDGFLSNSIGVNVIAIFNTDDEKEIDSTLIDSNNLLKIIKFGYLSENESNELSEHLDNKKTHKTSSKLIDIINKNKKPKNKKNFGL